MKKVNYLNIGCGSKFHSSWSNIDMISSSPYVLAHNVLGGLPYPDESFDVVYHSQVLEHIPKEKSLFFLKECFRVLKKNGVLRIVCPNLEGIAREYLKNLEEVIDNPDQLSVANYDWIMLEMYDQSVRHIPGGEMANYLEQPHLSNKNYIIGRVGYIGEEIITRKLFQSLNSKFYHLGANGKSTLRNIAGKLYRQLIGALTPKTFQVGRFRLGGEIHLWMYDRFSISRLLNQSGFIDFKIVSPEESSIPNWASYELDTKNGLTYDPTSLFVEAKKPL